jgi:hypothetical protein
MIGNSLKSDVLIVLFIGGQVVHILRFTPLLGEVAHEKTTL